MSAVVPRNGPARQIDRSGEPDRQLTPDQWADAPMMTRIVMGLLRDVARLKRRFWPDYIEFEDVTFDSSGSTVYRFPHGFGGRVRWWVVDMYGSAAGYALVKDEDETDSNTLCLISNEACVATIRIERAG